MGKVGGCLLILQPFHLTFCFGWQRSGDSFLNFSFCFPYLCFLEMILFKYMYQCSLISARLFQPETAYEYQGFCHWPWFLAWYDICLLFSARICLWLSRWLSLVLVLSLISACLFQLESAYEFKFFVICCGSCYSSITKHGASAQCFKLVQIQINWGTAALLILSPLSLRLLPVLTDEPCPSWTFIWTHLTWLIYYQSTIVLLLNTRKELSCLCTHLHWICT